MARNIGILASKEEMEEMYWGKGMTFRQIAPIFGVTDGAVRKWFRKLGVARRPRGGGWMDGRHKIAPPSKETLEDLYVEKQMSLRAIGRMFGVGSTLIDAWLKECGISRRPAYRMAQPTPDVEQLRSLYIGGESIARLARRYKADKPTVKGWLKQLEISIRDRGGPPGAEHPNWQGGISFEPYTSEFNRQLKELIRMRDGYRCQRCDCPQEECYRLLPIHHIDYDKANCLPSNLISLCSGCHAKVNWDREYWQAYFTNLLQSRGWGSCEVDTATSLREKVLSFGNSLGKEKKIGVTNFSGCEVASLQGDLHVKWSQSRGTLNREARESRAKPEREGVETGRLTLGDQMMVQSDLVGNHKRQTEMVCPGYAE